MNNGKMFIKCTSAPFWQHYVSSSLRFINDKTQFKMDVFPKFIIETDDQEGDCLIVAKCTYHKQLATDIKKVKGGGWWTLDKENSIFTLHGDSHDFGRAKIEDIASCVQRKKVFSSASLTRNFTDNFKFQYRNEVGEIVNLETYGSNDC